MLSELSALNGDVVKFSSCDQWQRSGIDEGAYEARRNVNARRNADGGELDHGEIVRYPLFEAPDRPAEMIDPVEDALDAVTLLV